MYINRGFEPKFIIYSQYAVPKVLFICFFLFFLKEAVLLACKGKIES